MKQVIIKDIYKKHIVHRVGRKFDVVAIDACDEYYWLPCPSRLFRKKEIVKKIKEVMTSKGTLTVNLFVRPKADLNDWEKVLKLHRSVFPTCLTVNSWTTNSVLICVPYKVEETPESKRLYENRLTEVISALNLSDSLRGRARLSFVSE
ncbi:hypothetical protein TELCIR_17558 [Teladorsagia circumcincta]|uniref:PABS domain-containing protein n=1 Tax=Teladorsagia circumcincta TaxID=45464 RepID=A0A2G9TSN2_TELCI|nr:hypothetical protein TELCIR_17558 [Teladorsagia circumcincta]